MSYEFIVGEYVTDKSNDEVWVIESMSEGDGQKRYRLTKHPNRPQAANERTVGESDITPLYLIHAHVDTASRDCDGTYLGGFTEVPNDDERRSEFGDLHFQGRVLRNIVTLHGYGTLTVNPDGLEWSEQTEEGYSRAEVRWCHDITCREDKRWQRDLQAEAAGY